MRNFQKTIAAGIIFLFCLFPYFLSSDPASSITGTADGYSILPKKTAPPVSSDFHIPLILESYMRVFPGNVRSFEFMNGDWTIQVAKDPQSDVEETFYWAGGRLLPERLLDKSADYEPFDFTPYPEQIPSPGQLNQEEIDELRRQDSLGAGENNGEHYYGFHGLLYGGITRGEIEKNLMRATFLGSAVTIHRDIAEALKRVESNIKNTALVDSEIASFINSIGTMGAYNWRPIQGTGNMSFHSWGLAVDIQPKELRGKTIYWLWERSFNDNWMLVPLARRWQPPPAVIKAFESEGFIWGGKWMRYDNMHFEYRPELHQFNKLLAEYPDGVKPPARKDLHHIAPPVEFIDK
jgi:hypothetical protein